MKGKLHIIIIQKSKDIKNNNIDKTYLWKYCYIMTLNYINNIGRH